MHSVQVEAHRHYTSISAKADLISAMVEKELGESNFGFDSLKSRLNHDMEEKGIVVVSDERCFRDSWQSSFTPILLHNGRDNPYESLLVVEVPESENPTQSLRFIISENIPVTLAAPQ